MYDNVGVFVLVNKLDLPHFVNEALKKRIIPFVVIRNKMIIDQVVNWMDGTNNSIYKPAEVVLTMNYPTDKYLD